MAAMVNMNSLLNGKDSRWLQLEVCREFQRNKCSRQDTECKFAHPPANVEVQNGKVTACYDSIKGRCNRDKPPCKYFHPPQHLKDQLLINGRNHLALKNALMQQMGIAPGQPVMSGQVPTVATNPYLTGIPANTYSPYFGPGHLVPTILGPDPSAVASQLGPVVSQAVPVAQQKIPRSDRLETAPVSAATLTHPIPTSGAAPPPNAVAIGHPLEVGKKRAAENDMFQLMDVKTVGSFYYENFAFSGMVPFKRPAGEKSGIPVYQPGATTYQQLMQLQQPFVPVSSSSKVPLNASYVIYTDANGQLLDTLPVCQDFNRSMCSRLNCRFVHLTEDDKVEVCDQRVAVCRDHANGQCRRKLCKYYHIPVALPPANIMATIFNQQPGQQSIHHPITLGAATTISLKEQKQQEQLEQQQINSINTNATNATTAPYTSISSHHNNNNIINSLSNNIIYKNLTEKNKNTIAPYQHKTLSPTTTLLRKVSSSSSSSASPSKSSLNAVQNFALASPQSPKSTSESSSNIFALTTSTSTISNPVMSAAATTPTTTTTSNLSASAIAHVYAPTFDGYLNAQQHLTPTLGYYDIINQGISNIDSNCISVLTSNPTYVGAPLLYTSKVSQHQNHDRNDEKVLNRIQCNANNLKQHQQHHSSVSNLP